MKRAALAMIRWYRLRISPLSPPACRYEPSCSQYAYVAIERFGLFVGGLMGLGRILRCHPFHEGGWDPVPSAPDDPCSLKT